MEVKLRESEFLGKSTHDHGGEDGVFFRKK